VEEVHALASAHGIEITHPLTGIAARPAEAGRTGWRALEGAPA
jgi:hypothetical protein